MSRIWRILTRALKSIKNLHFNGLLLNKVQNVLAKKVKRVIRFPHISFKYARQNYLCCPMMAEVSLETEPN